MSTMPAVDGLRTDERLAAAGFVAGFTTSALGSMHEASNRAKALERVGLGGLPSYLHKQVHGNRVVDLFTKSDQSENVDSPREADGWALDKSGRVAVIYAADCTPIFIWDKRGRAGAILHSGWKGTQANIAAEGVKALEAKGVMAAEMEAFIGPRANACCYSVSDDFVNKFRAESLERRGGKLYFDLGKEAKAQLIGVGVIAANVVVSTDCTVCGSDFYSYRRAKDGTRMMGFLAKRHE
jgi:YfiH family protein